ncbi:MAG: hypothetical protein ABW224_17795 [Kibdelosporangium sp.]
MGRRLAWILPVLVVAGCGKPVQQAGSTSSNPPVPPTLSAPATRLPDGTVPWVDEPGIDQEYDLPPKARRADPKAEPCKANQLKGELAEWLGPSGYVEPGARPSREPAKLIGYVRITNTGTATCKLQGEVDTRLLAGGTEVQISYSHGINAEAAARPTIVPPGERAELRLDWTGPFCAAATGTRELLLRLPAGGGDLRAAVTTTDSPPCSREPGGSDRGSFLSSSAFDEPQDTTVRTSPLSVLKATVQPLAAAPTGKPATFHVRLDNPTGQAVSLQPCPGYALGLYSSAAKAGEKPVNSRFVYRLNCRPVKEIPAGGSARFAIGLFVPLDLTAGREMFVDWQLRAPDLSNEVRGDFKLLAT